MRLVDTIGIGDPDVKRADHDDMCFAVEALLAAGAYNRETPLDRSKFIDLFIGQLRGSKNFESYCVAVERVVPASICESRIFVGCEFEYPIEKDGRILGFIDVWARFSRARPRLHRIDSPDFFKYKEEIEEVTLAFECKPQIRSAGEVVRQLKLYAHLLEGHRATAVVYEDDPKLEALKAMWPYIVRLKRPNASRPGA